MKKLAKILGLGIIFSMCWASISFAGATYCTKATIIKIGDADGATQVTLRNDSGVAVGASDEWPILGENTFYLNTATEDRQLATALTAYSLSESMVVVTTNGYAHGAGVISQLYIGR